MKGRLLGSAILALYLAGCAALIKPEHGENVVFPSRDHVFIDDILSAHPSPRRWVGGTLVLPRGPAASAPPFPAVIILHTASGVGTLEWTFAKSLLERKIAVFVIDSFSPRDVIKTTEDQAAVTEAMMIADGYAALGALARDPRIRRDRIALIGFSKGGTAALLSALERIRENLAARGLRFAAHVAFYPWCGLTLIDRRVTGAPVQIHVGGRDSLMPGALCESFANELKRANPGAPIAFFSYQGARHAFNHPLLANLPALPTSVQTPGDCRIEEEAPNRFVERSTRRALSRESYREVLSLCMGFGGSVGYHEAAARLAAARTHALLTETLLGPGP
ncbi:MAG: dienelactone hydrolase family protein [Alphaproteobacteria bacterium]